MGNLNETLAASVLPGFAGKVAELLGREREGLKLFLRPSPAE